MKGHRSPDSLGVGIFLVGLGVLFLLPGRVGFFPWILVVIGLAGLPSAMSGSRGWAAWQGLFWLIGLAVLFATGSIWPGILILAGASMLMGALSGGTRAKEATEPDVAHEPVTTTRLPQVALPEPVPAPMAEVDLVDHGTAPLSRDDLDALEAELAATVEGTAALAPSPYVEDAVPQAALSESDDDMAAQNDADGPADATDQL